MKRSSLLLVSLILLLCSTGSVISQSDTTGQMLLTEGLAFRIAAIVPSLAPAETIPPNALTLYLTSRKGARVTVNGSDIVDVVPNDVTIVRVNDLESVVTLRGDRPFAVSSYQDLYGNGEQAWHLPTYAWGTSYRPFQWWQDSYGLNGLITTNMSGMQILAGERGATVTIEQEPMDRTEVLPPYGSTTVFEYFEDGLTRNTNSDPTGRLVTSDQPIAVVSGHPKAAVLRFPEGLPPIGEYARAASRSRGNLHDAMLPTELSGSYFITVPLLYTPTRIRGFMLEEQGIEDDHGDVIRFIALEDSTVITSMSDTIPWHTDTLMNAGDTWYAPRVEQATVWYASKRVMCAHYGKSFGRIISQADRPDLDPTVDAGLPLLMNVPSITQWTDYATFMAPESTANFVNVVCLAKDEWDIRIDGRPIASVLRKHTIGSTPYVAYSGLIPPGMHTLHTFKEDVRFGAWTYGSLDGLQLGKIYGAVASMDLALPCEDTIVVTQETTPDSIVFTYRADTRSGSDNDTCAQIAMVYLDRCNGGTATVSDTSVIVRRTTPTTMVDGVVVFVTRSGRYLRRPFHLDGTTSVIEVLSTDIPTDVPVYAITGERVLHNGRLSPGVYAVGSGMDRRCVIVR